MIEKLYLLSALAIIGNMIAYDFTPLQPAKDRFIGLFTGRSPSLFRLFDGVLNCSKCASFWLGFFVSQSILDAAVAGFLGYLVNFIYDKIKFWYEG
jgi:hypothetical protein